MKVTVTIDTNERSTAVWALRLFATDIEKGRDGTEIDAFTTQGSMKVDHQTPPVVSPEYGPQMGDYISHFRDDKSDYVGEGDLERRRDGRWNTVNSSGESVIVEHNPDLDTDLEFGWTYYEYEIEVPDAPAWKVKA